MMQVREIDRFEINRIFQESKQTFNNLEFVYTQFNHIHNLVKKEILYTKEEIAEKELRDIRHKIRYGYREEDEIKNESQKVLNATGIRLDTDYIIDQTNILKEIYLHQKHSWIIDILERESVLSEYKDLLNGFPKSNMLWGLQWRFTRKSKKEELQNKINKLESLNENYEEISEKVTNDLLPALDITPDELWRKFKSDKETFYSSLKSLHDVEVSPVSREDYYNQKIIHSDLNIFYLSAQSAFQQKKESRDIVIELIKEESKEEIKNELLNTSLDEFSRLYPDHGLRLNLLAQNGIETVAEMADYPSFYSISGIGFKTNERIKIALNHYKEEVYKSIGFQFNTEIKPKNHIKIIRNLYFRVNHRELYKNIEQLELNFQQIKFMSILDDINIRSEWSFQQLAKNEHIMSEHNKKVKKLNDFENRNHANILNFLEHNKEVSKLEEKEIWSNFNANAADYYAILERDFGVGSSSVESTIKKSGLSELIIEQIKNFKLNEEGLNATLRSWQDFGAKYALLQKKVLIGDEMGLGKTLISIAAMTHLVAEEGKTHFLVICPASIMTNWERELAKFSSLKVFRTHGNYRNEVLNEWKKNGGVAITTFETSLVLDFENVYPIDMITVDEAHYIKNPDAKRTKGVRELTDKSTYAIYLTGTPLENKVVEMTEIIRPLESSIAKEVQKPRMTVSANDYRKKVAPVYLRRTKKDVSLELPPLIQIEEWEEFGDEEFKEYRDAVANGKFMRMRRAAWTGGTKEKSPKLQRLLELTNEAYENDSKVIVFTFFRDVITTVVEALGDRVVEPIHGGVPINQRQEIIDEFRDSKTKNVLVAQINTAAHGLNIQFANTIIFCEPQIKPSLESQAVARAYRMGQVDNVFVYRLLTVNSIDELMMDMLGNKQALFDQFADRSHLQDELIGLEEKEDKDSKNIQTKIIDLEAERLNIERVSKEIETV